MRVAPFTPDDSERWDGLVEAAPMATFLHTRRFLSYHGERFQDASVLLTDDGGTPRALLPAAIDPRDPARVVSHPGATFGGLVHDGGLQADGVLEALRAVAGHYAEGGFAAWGYKPVPHIYHRSPSGDDVWALSALGASRVACSLSCAIDLESRRSPSSRRARSHRKALAAGVAVSDASPLASFWPLLETTLDERYSTRPVHSLDEIELLRDRFPDAIRLLTGVLDGYLVAGMVVFVTPRVVHMQYAASSATGRKVGALDAVAERGIELAAAEGARYFDFGTSMEGRGPGLQSGLHSFKAEFGGGGVVHEQYELALGADRT